MTSITGGEGGLVKKVTWLIIPHKQLRRVTLWLCSCPTPFMSCPSPAGVAGLADVRWVPSPWNDLRSKGRGKGELWVSHSGVYDRLWWQHAHVLSPRLDCNFLIWPYAKNSVLRRYFPCLWSLSLFLRVRTCPRPSSSLALLRSRWDSLETWPVWRKDPTCTCSVPIPADLRKCNETKGVKAQ